MNTLPANFVVIDCESSGLSPERHALLSVGAVTASGREFYRECLFDERKEIDAEAMAVNGINLALNTSDDVWPEQAVAELIAWLREEHTGRWIFGGKNPQFDWGFLCAAAGPAFEAELVTVICRRGVDLHSWAYLWAMQRGIDFTADGFTTDLIYAHLGFQPELKPHHALNGARHEMGIFRALVNGKVLA